MYEFTMGGMWFRWRLLDRSSKRLAAGSMIAALIGSVPIGVFVGKMAYRYGYWMGSGGQWPDTPPPTLAPWMATIAIASAIVSAMLWWRFSLRQDEMFNRVQNWSLGMAGAWSMAAALVWAALAYSGMSPMITVGGIFFLFCLAVIGFWMVAVRRWA